MQAVVIAAGLGTRLRPLTERFAKPVLPIDGRPVVAVLLRELAAAELSRVTVVTGHLGAQVRRLLEDGSAFGLELAYAEQAEPLGSAHAVAAAAPEPPYGLAGAFQRGIDAGEPVAGIPVGPTRDLTSPVDLLVENFPYLRD
ncbi:MAG TPA: sugar phosphate nucleotidyltransferase, partial [Gaiellaceae bacterium]|nr:sugar phosphate nucleotidyltransferase [Gaiellaceae bacterium]